ncbi:ATP-grasp domain-containing protein [Streptomyces sp. NBC_01498]|uniref:acetyl/propionyl/methylcrotonyl-CoA carboxylase subunit alpha n=1 Tax=Streptomyces sp. NBC_01498 TaxID=2975870 RepID=UPI002E7B7E7C|nr:biotin carboxylase N-terminal domain-containing protein [Streptomyces sp. NBC_01498]WTL28871.1 ATP-grasp domain-containing protein [Streptomyces sp. NBC_01498]
MISALLVANRGEIARRVFRTCRERGIGTVAVFSDEDAGAAHVREADAAVRLPGAAPADTYLRGDRIVKAALAAGADAVHPGYGFLSENAGFARAVLDAGLVWVGPPPEAIEAMASKTRAKELMAAAGVPLLAPVDPATATDADLPLLIKAAAGGGGRGMRIVRTRDAIGEEWEAASAEARSAFGDGEVFAEPYVERGRHVEVQILADAHGTVWALGTRDCSLQRRHQKVIEEAPAPGLNDELRATLTDAAVAAARAVDYRGAGTVEFLVSPTGKVHFLEMNTRLQVEHPVTEEVFGVDLVALQLAVAEGGTLPPEPPAARGHAVEARLYAEDPANGWAPRPGRVHALTVPGAGTGASAAGAPDAPGAGPRLRVDSGYGPGDRVGVHYDSLLAKVIAWAPTRAGAVRLLADALRRARVHGPVTNRDLLVRSLKHPEFTDGRADTGFYGRHLDALTGPGDDREARHAALAAALADAARRGHPLGGWRNLASQPQTKTYGQDGERAPYEVRYHRTRDGYRAEDDSVRPASVTPGRVGLEVDGVLRHFDVAEYGDGHVHVDGPAGAHRLRVHPRFTDPRAATAPGSLLAPMPGTVVRIAEGLGVGSAVTAGQPLVWLEAMKMEHRVTAPASGTLTALHATPGGQVEVGALLAVVTAAPTDPDPVPTDNAAAPTDPAPVPTDTAAAPTDTAPTDPAVQEDRSA